MKIENNKLFLIAQLHITSVPDVPNFKRFQQSLPNINVNDFYIGL